METLDYTKDKDLGESPLPQQAVYLPDPKVTILQSEVILVTCTVFHLFFHLFLTFLLKRLLAHFKEKFGIWILNRNRKKKKKM